MTHFAIWIVSPAGYPHSRCFEEVALALHEAFAVLGYDAPIVTDPARIRDRAVVLGANVLKAQPLPPGCILYNLEQIERDSPWLTSDYLELLRSYPVWDYSERNIERLREVGVERAALCGVGYTPGLTRIAPGAEQDIDVLFVGSLNERRRAVTEEIAEMGHRVTTAFNAYGAERDALIARAKIVLNLHLYGAKVFEIVRVSYLLANRKCVVSEQGRDPALESPLEDGIAFADYDDLADTCASLLARPDERAALAERGFATFSALSQVPMLRRALQAHGYC